MENEAKKLLIKYSKGHCTPKEISLIESWYLADELDYNTSNLTMAELDRAKNSVWRNLPVHQTYKTKPVKIWTGYIRFAAAAVIVLSVSVGLYFATQKTIKEEITKTANTPILPGGKKASLTLANGISIVLNDIQNGKIADQTGTSIFKAANGEIVYHTEANQNRKVEFNQLSIPRGGYYLLTLADGTKIWLNAESSLKYPTHFVGSERVVELTGEGYFEVAHRKNQPFKVVTNKQTIEVLGTRFNINAYDNEKVTTTTLLEGSINITYSLANDKKKDLANVILKPGQQAKIKNGEISVKEVNMEDAVSWVNNSFVFNDEELGSIMRQLSRWYDIDVVCTKEVEKLAFFGKISRRNSIKDIIKIIEKTKDVNFKIEGRRVTVMH
jgi:ferric-dicitrate binding protein FerR (iron transport regulator)